VWQSALPPTLCTICVSVIYIRFSTARQVSALPFYPCSGFFWRLVRGSSLERRTLTTGFPFSEKIAVLADGYPGDDREALRSFAVLHDVRRFDLTCIRISVVHTISDAMSMIVTLGLYNRTSDLQRSYRRSLCQQRPCIHLRGDPPEGETLR